MLDRPIFSNAFQSRTATLVIICVARTAKQ